MKRPEYVAGVVRVYRKLIDRYLKKPSDFHVREEEKHTLLQLFNRDFTTGYFFGDPGGELMSRKYPHNRGTELGKVIDYEPRKRTASINLLALLRTGDGIGIGGRETGVIVRNIYLHDRWVRDANPGSTVKIFLENEVKSGDIVFKTYDSLLMASPLSNNQKTIPVKMLFTAGMGKPCELHLEDDMNHISVQGRITTAARKSPISKEAIKEQLKKLGNTVFKAKEIIVDIDENVFIPVSELNALRREAVLRLEKIRAGRWKRNCEFGMKHNLITDLITGSEVDLKPMPKPILSVNTSSMDCFEAAVNSGADVVYIGHKLYRDFSGGMFPNCYVN